jgi:hypothetical protein
MNYQKVRETSWQTDQQFLAARPPKQDAHEFSLLKKKCLRKTGAGTNEAE